MESFPVIEFARVCPACCLLTLNLLKRLPFGVGAQAHHLPGVGVGGGGHFGHIIGQLRSQQSRGQNVSASRLISWCQYRLEISVRFRTVLLRIKNAAIVWSNLGLHTISYLGLRA